MARGNRTDNTYLNLLDTVLTGTPRTDRTGTGTLSVFGTQSRYNLRHGFPLLTTKKVHWNSVVTELLWFLRGGTNTAYLHKHGVTIWDEWADENGDLGPVYGQQWRSWSDGLNPYDLGPNHIDQIANVIESIKTDPFSRRHIVSAWNPSEVGNMALPPCHMMFQFYVEPDEDGKPARLSCHLYQRSGDVFLGVPFNIASYALLTHMVAHVTGLEVGEFVHTIGDAHLYNNHVAQAMTQLGRDPLDLPTLTLNPEITSIDDFTHADIVLNNYVSHPAIKAKVAV